MLVVGTVQSVTGTFLVQRVLLVDVTPYITDANPSQATVNSVGQTWLSENLVGLPEINLKLSYAQFDQVVRLFDTVTVKIEKMGVDVVAKITQTVYDVIKERNVSVNVGDTRPTFAADIYDASRLKTGLLDMKRIKDKSITAGKIGSGAATERVIEDEAVTTWKLKDHAVVGSKILDGAIGSSKIFDGAVTTPKLYDGAVTAGKIESHAVGISKLDSTVTGFFNGTLSFNGIKVNGISLEADHDGIHVKE